MTEVEKEIGVELPRTSWIDGEVLAAEIDAAGTLHLQMRIEGIQLLRPEVVARALQVGNDVTLTASVPVDLGSVDASATPAATGALGDDDPDGRNSDDG